MQSETSRPKWQQVFEDAIVPLLSERQMEVLEEAMVQDDPCLLQGATTTPPPLQAVLDWPVEAACALGYCFWKGSDLETVAEVEEKFAMLCFEIDQLLGEPAGCRWWLNYWDETPRHELFAEVLPVVQKALAARREAIAIKE